MPGTKTGRRAPGQPHPRSQSGKQHKRKDYHIRKGRETYIIVVLIVTALIAFFTAFNGRLPPSLLRESSQALPDRKGYQG
jgi:hypothetical protein